MDNKSRVRERLVGGFISVLTLGGIQLKVIRKSCWCLSNKCGRAQCGNEVCIKSPDCYPPSSGHIEWVGWLWLQVYTT